MLPDPWTLKLRAHAFLSCFLLSLAKRGHIQNDDPGGSSSSLVQKAEGSIDQVPKNMRRVRNAQCNQEEGYSSLAGITWKNFSRVWKAGKNKLKVRKTKRAEHFNLKIFYKHHIHQRKLNILKFQRSKWATVAWQKQHGETMSHRKV